VTTEKRSDALSERGEIVQTKDVPKLLDIEFHKPNFRTYIFQIGRKAIRCNVRRKSLTLYLTEYLENYALTEDQEAHIRKIIGGEEEWKRFDPSVAGKR
jgi:hypothetical protein